jgi:hypothetical protein
MMRRAILAFATLIALNQTATAGLLSFGHVSCTMVRFYVGKYSEVAAEKWARSHGASDAEIETARHCLHSANVQTASSAVKSQAPVTEQERAQPEPAKPEPVKLEPAKPDPAKSDPAQDAPHVTPVVSVQDQRADPRQDYHESESGGHDVIRPKDIDVGHASYESKDPSRSDGKTTTLGSRYVGAMHRVERSRATGVSWLKRLWDHLTKRRQFSVALLHFGGGRR